MNAYIGFTIASGIAVILAAIIVGVLRVTYRVRYDDIYKRIGEELEDMNISFDEMDIEPTNERGPFSIVDIDVGAPIHKVNGIPISINSTDYYRIRIVRYGNTKEYHAKIQSTFRKIRHVYIEEAV